MALVEYTVRAAAGDAFRGEGERVDYLERAARQVESADEMVKYGASPERVQTAYLRAIALALLGVAEALRPAVGPYERARLLGGSWVGKPAGEDPRPK